MYKQASRVQKSVHDSWLLVDVDEQRSGSRTKSFPSPELQSRDSDPITIFSAGNAQSQAGNQGILPVHNGQGYFTSNGQEQHTGIAARHAEYASDLESSLSSVLEEVLDSVDAAQEVCHRKHTNSRIEAWLKHQARLETLRGDTLSTAEVTSMKKTSYKLLRKLIGCDKEFLTLLLTSDRKKCSEQQDLASLQVEQRMLQKFIRLAQRDTLFLQRHMYTRDSTMTAARASLSASQRESTRRTTMERIPWGVPEEPRDEAYWAEELSFPMLFRYIKSYFHKTAANEEREQVETERNVKQARLATSTSVATQTTEKTAHAISTTTASHHTIRQSYMTTSRAQRLSNRHTRRSRASQSSSFRSTSVRTTTSCSIASVRHSAVGGHFWDIGSLGGASAQGQWSVHA